MQPARTGGLQVGGQTEIVQHVGTGSGGRPHRGEVVGGGVEVEDDPIWGVEPVLPGQPCVHGDAVLVGQPHQGLATIGHGMHDGAALLGDLGRPIQSGKAPAKSCWTKPFWSIPRG